ncbi:MAG: peptidylprolyl isomerase [Rhodoglobus sp.]
MATKKSKIDREARERLRLYKARQSVHALGVRRRKRDNIIAIIGVVLVATIATATQLVYFNGGPGTPASTPSATPANDATGQNVGDVPDPSTSEDRLWTGTLTLNDIPLGIQLDGIQAPQAVAAVTAAAQSGYYLNKTCHRLVAAPTAGLIQCGSIDGAGSSDPEFSFGPLENTPSGGIYPAGTIAMARGSDAYSNGRQFFIVFADTTLPDDDAGGYTVIGTVTSGLEQLSNQIGAAGTTDGTQDGAPAVATSITALTIT